MKTLSHDQARIFYDRFGAKQDLQRFYEDRAVEELMDHLALDSARSLLEFGCGTGRLAQGMLERELSSEARYLGIDISSTMVGLAQRRLRAFGARARVMRSGGAMELDVQSASYDRFLAIYVLDLLAEEDIARLLHEAHRILAAGGRLGLVSLTHGATAAARLVEKTWMALHRLRPSLVGGCRPLRLADFLGGSDWEILHQQAITQWGITSEVVVAARV
jgi:ubiquinone/menaquinone biosynthesis C-methylase UbiE